MQDVISELQKSGARVGYGVDAAALPISLPSGWLPKGGFDRVVWNFPCAIDNNAQSGRDGRVGCAQELECNRKLLSRFFLSASSLLSPEGGEVGCVISC